MFQILAERLKERKYAKIDYEKFEKSDPLFKSTITDIEWTIGLDCFEHSGTEWETIFKVPCFLDKELVLKEIKKRCKSRLVNNGCKLLVKNGNGHLIHIYGKENDSFFAS